MSISPSVPAAPDAPVPPDVPNGPAVPNTANTVLLGPQRFTTTLAPTLDQLQIEGPIAIINSGWQERESDDEELQGHLGSRGRNLRLFERMTDVITKDSAFAEGALEFRDAQEELQTFYGVRMRGACQTLVTVLDRTSRHGMRSSAFESHLQVLREIDQWYIDQLKQLYRDLATKVSPFESPVVGWHKGQIAESMDGVAAVVMPGGHVGDLLRSLRLFDIRLPASLPVVAWSAGAMALTKRVLLFHDFAPQGITEPELYDHGLGRLPGIIAMPHARKRLKLDDPQRMMILAQRFAAYRLLLLDEGAKVAFDSTADPLALPAGARFITPEGSVEVVA